MSQRNAPNRPPRRFGRTWWLLAIIAAMAFSGCQCISIIPWGTLGELSQEGTESGGERQVTPDSSWPEPSPEPPPTPDQPNIVPDPVAPDQPPIDTNVPDVPVLPDEPLAPDTQADTNTPEPTPDVPSVCTRGETRPCYTPKSGCKETPQGFQCQGRCKAGTQLCNNGQWDSCKGSIGPTKELCDAQDNDCDGVIDEDLGVLRCGIGSCANQVDACQGGKKGTCQPKAPGKEQCGNELDDDCDGKINEDCEACLPSRIIKVFPNAHVGEVRRVAFHPNGLELLTASEDRSAKIWNLRAGSITHTLIHTGEIDSLAIHPKGQFVAASTTREVLARTLNEVVLWDYKQRTKLHTINIAARANDIAFDPTSSRIAVAIFSSISTYDTSTGKLEKRLPQEHTQTIARLSYNKQGVLASCGIDGKVILWQNDTKLRQWEAHKNGVSACKFTPAGSILTGGKDGTVKLWSDTGKLIRNYSNTGGAGAVNAVAIEASGRHVAAAFATGQTRVWDTNSGVFRKTLAANSKSTLSVSFSNNGQLLATSASDGGVRLWNWQTNQKPTLLSTSSQGQNSAIWSAMFHPGGRVLASQSQTGQVALWDAETGKRLFYSPKGGGGGINLLAFQPDGRYLAFGSGFGIRFLDINSLRITPGSITTQKPVTSLSYRADSKQIAVATESNDISIWAPATRRRLSTLKGHKSQVQSLAYHPSGKWLASGGKNGELLLWDLTTQKIIHTFPSHNGATLSVTFSHDGTLMLSGSVDKSARLWDFKTRKLLKSFSDGTAIWQVSFSPKSKYFAIASSWLSAATIWDVKTQKKVQTLSGHTGWVLSATFSSRGRLMATGSDDKTVIVWGCQ